MPECRGDATTDVRDVGHPRQVHQRRPPPDLPHPPRVGREQARLAEAPGGHQADAHPVRRPASELRELALTVDQELRGDGSFERERRSLTTLARDHSTVRYYGPAPAGTTGRCRPDALLVL